MDVHAIYFFLGVLTGFCCCGLLFIARSIHGRGNDN